MKLTMILGLLFIAHFSEASTGQNTLTLEKPSATLLQKNFSVSAYQISSLQGTQSNITTLFRTPLFALSFGIGKGNAQYRVGKKESLQLNQNEFHVGLLHQESSAIAIFDTQAIEVGGYMAQINKDTDLGNTRLTSAYGMYFDQTYTKSMQRFIPGSFADFGIVLKYGNSVIMSSNDRFLDAGFKLGIGVAL